jgi:hypothetical protein
MKIGRIEITDKCWIYIDNVKVGNVQYACKEVQFIERLKNLRIVDKAQYKIKDPYLGAIIKQIEPKINWELWDKYKYDL